MLSLVRKHRFWIIFQIKKVLMVDCNKVSSMFDTQELMEYLRLVGTLGEVTSYSDLFPILTLIALLSGDGLSSEGARFATDMRNKYFTVLVKIAVVKFKNKNIWSLEKEISHVLLKIKIYYKYEIWNFIDFSGAKTFQRSPCLLQHLSRPQRDRRALPSDEKIGNLKLIKSLIWRYLKIWLNKIRKSKVKSLERKMQTVLDFSNPESKVRTLKRH